MANTAANVSFGKPKVTGGVYVAPKGTTVPTDATTALDGAFKSLGYVSEDGLVNSIETDTETVKAWGGDTVLSGLTSFTETFTVNLIETNAETLKTIYGPSNVTVGVGGAITIKANSKPLDEQVVVFEIGMTGGRIKRIVVEHAQITDRSAEVKYVDNEAITYPAKFMAYPDKNGNTHTEYIAMAA